MGGAYAAGVGAEAPGAGWHHGVSLEMSLARSAEAGTVRIGVVPARRPQLRQPACHPGTRAAAAEAQTLTPMRRDAAVLATAVLSKPTAPTKRQQGLHTKDRQPAKTVENERRVSLSLRVSGCYCVDPNQTAATVTAGNAALRALTPLFP